MEHMRGRMLCSGGASRRMEAHCPILRPTVAKADMGWVPLEAAYENRGDVTELDHPGGVWGYPMPALVRALAWALSL